MTLYLLLLGVCAGLGLLSRMGGSRACKREIYLALVFALLVALSSFRYATGAAYSSYVYIFDAVEMVKADGFAAAEQVVRQNGYTVEPSLLLLIRLCQRMGMNARGFLTVAAFICLLPVWWLIRRHSPIAWLSVWLYITFLCFAATMDAVRQCMAAGVLMLGYPLLRQRGWQPTLRYGAVCAFASLIHQTALIMLLPLLFIQLPRRKLALALWCGMWAAACLFGKQLVLLLLETVLPALGMGDRFGYYVHSSFLEGSHSMVMMAAPVGVFVIYLLLYRRIRQHAPEDALPLLYLLSFTVGAWLMVAQTRIMLRLILFTMPYAVLALPIALSSIGCRDERAIEAQEKLPTSSREHVNQVLLTILIVGGSLAYFCYNGLPTTAFHGHWGMYLCVPYTSYLPWLNWN
ncbi:MAG: EpsG family protein [Eubacteriales bacterium]|nr:EpsG family protein [Eubacteriales bacterium]